MPKLVCARVSLCPSSFVPNNRWTDPTNNEVPRFKRCFVSCAACIHVAFGCGIKFNAIDATYSRHSVYRQGYLHMLSTRDGNNKILPLAWAICETESGPTYEFFADQCHAAGLHRYLTRNSVLFSDRQKGLEKFHERFNSHRGRCVLHIIRNARDHIRGSSQIFQNKTVWALQEADTEEKYLEQLEVLRGESEKAADYFDDLPHEEVYLYAFLQKGVRTHGHKTSNIAESVNWFLNEARHEAPYRCNDKICTWIGKEFAARTETMQKWLEQGHMLTPYAHNLFATQVCAHMIALCPHDCFVPISLLCAHMIALCPYHCFVPT